MDATKVLVLKAVKADMTAPCDKAGGFKYPESGPVEAPDWDPKPECGAGLHGLLWGQGDWSLVHGAVDAKYLVIEVDPAEMVDLQGKVKFRRGSVVFCGRWWQALQYVSDHRPPVKAEQTATGDSGHAAATGNSGHAAVLGYGGRAKAGANGVIALSWWDGKRPRVAVGYVGENDIKADTWYRVEDGKLVEVKS